MGHSALSQGIVMSASPSIRLSEVLSPPQQRVSAAPQSLPGRPCSCGSFFFFFQRGARGHLEVTASRGAATFLTWNGAALGRVKNAKLVTRAEQALALFSSIRLSPVPFSANSK